MDEKENLDLNRVISLIMENPQIIRQISDLANQSQKQDEAEQEIESVSVPPSAEEPAEKPIAQPAAAEVRPRTNRAQLFGALKPYVSKERAKAIDSMLSIADILDMMKAR